MQVSGIQMLENMFERSWLRFHYSVFLLAANTLQKKKKNTTNICSSSVVWSAQAVTLVKSHLAGQTPVSQKI